jgi:hypothetical protein
MGINAAAWAVGHAPGGRMRGSIVAKVVIAVVAFPLFAHVIYTAVTFVLGFVLPHVLERAGTWSDLLGKTAVVMTLLFAARTSFRICRRLWPTPSLQS